MYEAWRRTTLVFVAHIISISIARFTGIESTWTGALIFTTLFLWMLFLLPPLRGCGIETLFAMGVVMTIFDAWAYHWLNQAVPVLLGGAIVWVAAKDMSGESLGMRVLVRIPLGVGTVLGGLVLLHRNRRLTARSSKNPALFREYHE